MKLQIKTITPQMAASMLELNTKNRPLNVNHINDLADLMRRGKWETNGETIKLNGNRVLDGQHRLWAIVESGSTITTCLATEVPEEVYDTIDTGRRRSGGDTLAVVGEKNCNALASALTILSQYLAGAMTRKFRVPNLELRRILRNHPGMREIVNMKALVKGGFINPSVLFACYYLFRKSDELMADKFIGYLVSGIDLEAGNPALILRERLIKNQMSQAKFSREYAMAITIKAWNAFIEGRRISHLRWVSGEEFQVAK